MITILLTIILYIAIGLLLGLVNTMLVFFIDFCFNEQNIFDWYYLFLLRHVQPKYPKLAKPLGLCPVCMGFWVGLGVFSLLALTLSLPVWVFLPFTAASSFTLIKLFKPK
jgi:hypothetical protein